MNVFRHDLFTSHDDRIGRLGLLQIGKGKALYPDAAVLSHILCMDNGDIGVKGREKDELILAFSKGFARNDELFRATFVSFLVWGPNPLLIDDVGSQSCSARYKGDAQGAGEESKAHLVVGIILDFYLSVLLPF